MVHTENEIDGKTLLLLVNDVQEFNAIVPKVVSRLKIKKLVRDYSDFGHDSATASVEVNCFIYVATKAKYYLDPLGDSHG